MVMNAIKCCSQGFACTAASGLVGKAKAVTSEMTSPYPFPTIDSKSIHLSSQKGLLSRKKIDALGID